MIITGREDINLADTFECGQCFRWEREDDGSYTGMAGDKAANIRAAGDVLYIDGDGDEEFWRRYLDLDRDYRHIKRTLAEADDKIGAAIEAGPGIHILAQDGWETIVSFIISQNNNIPRIKKCIEGLCRGFGEYAGRIKGREMYSFPGKERLSGVSAEDLAEIRLGYRAGYIAGTAAADFDPGQDLSYETLLTLPGVGPKVASCIRLFGYGDMASFPIDVWVRRVMNRVYGFSENDTAGMKAYAEEHFGAYGGIAQQYLFNSVKNH